MTRAESTLFADIAARIVDVSTFVNLSPLAESLPKKLTRIRARIIQKSGPRRTLRARALVKVIFFLLTGLASFFEFFSLMNTYALLERR